jgi:hypothetical protein
MFASIRLPTVRQDTTSLALVPLPGAELQFTIIERAAVVDISLAGVFQHAATGTPVGETDLPAVQGQVTVATPMANDANWHVLPFNQIDIENNPAVIEFVPAGNNVEIKETGLYELHYVVELDPSGISTYEFRFAKNGTTVIEGSEHHTFESSQITDIGVQVLAELVAGDTVTLEYNSGGATGAEVVHAVANISRLRGSSLAVGGGEVHLTFEVNGVDVAAPYTDGLVSHTASLSQQIEAHHRMVLDPGEYNIRALWKTNDATGTGASLRADLFPASLSAEVRSHPGTLAQGVTGKQHGAY